MYKVVLIDEFVSSTVSLLRDSIAAAPLIDKGKRFEFRDTVSNSDPKDSLRVFGDMNRVICKEEGGNRQVCFIFCL